MRRRGAAAALLLALVSAAAAGTEDAPAASWRLGAQSLRHSDPLPLAAWGSARDPWAELAPRAGRNLVWLDEELRLSRREGAWQASLLARSHGVLVADQASLQLAAQVARGQRPAADFAADAELHLRAFSGAGLAFGHERALPGGWRLTGEVQALTLGRWLERRIEGPIRYDAAGASYGFRLRSEQLDDRLDFPFREGFASRGTALLFSGGVAWRSEGFFASASLRDGGWLRWRDVPRQDAVLDTATSTVDADGFLVYKPLIEGRNRQGGLTRSTPWLGRLEAGIGTAAGDIGLQLDAVPRYGVLPALRWAAAPRSEGAAPGWALAWRPHERRIELQLAWRGLRLQAGADRVGSGARSRVLAASWTSGFD